MAADGRWQHVARPHPQCHGVTHHKLLRGSDFVLTLMLRVLLACGDQAEMQAQDHCVDRVPSTSARTSEDRAFDVAFDRNAAGASFACDIGVRASDARKVLDDFRFGVLYQSEPHLIRSVHFPLTVNLDTPASAGRRGQALVLRTPSEFISFATERLERMHIALIACAHVRNVDIIKSRSFGFTIGPGIIWFVPTVERPYPMVTAISLAPVTETQLAQHCANARPHEAGLPEKTRGRLL